MTLVDRLNPNDPNSPADLEIKLLYGGAVHDQRVLRVGAAEPRQAARLVHDGALQHDRT